MNSTMNTLMTIAESAFRSGNFVKAEFFLRRMERVGRATGCESEAMAVGIENLAIAQVKLQKFSTAIATFERTLKFRLDAGFSDKTSRSRINYELAEAHLYERNYFRAEQCLKRAWTEDAQRESNLSQLWRLVVVLGLQNKFDEERYYRSIFVALKQQQRQIEHALGDLMHPTAQVLLSVTPVLLPVPPPVALQVPNSTR